MLITYAVYPNEAFPLINWQAAKRLCQFHVYGETTFALYFGFKDKEEEQQYILEYLAKICDQKPLRLRRIT